MSEMIEIDKLQFEKILNVIESTNYWEIYFFPILLVFIAAVSGVLSQRFFERRKEKEKMIKEAHQFNEAVVYLKALIEGVMSNAGQNVLPLYLHEETHLNEIDKKVDVELYQNTFTTIPQLRTAETECFLDKIPDIGAYNEMISAFYMVQDQIKHFNFITDERDNGIKEQRGLSFQRVETGLIKDRTTEIYQKTTLLLAYLDGALDGLIFISKELDAIKKQLKKTVEKDSIKVVSFAPQTDQQETLRKDIIKIIETKTEWKGRFRFLSET